MHWPVGTKKIPFPFWLGQPLASPKIWKLTIGRLNLNFKACHGNVAKPVDHPQSQSGSTLLTDMGLYHERHAI